jgi:hypothetical protein
MNGQNFLRPRLPMNRRAFVGMMAAGAAGTLVQNAAAAQPAPKARNVVLVHGLFADGSSWSEVIARLQAAGLNATSVQNPRTTLSSPGTDAIDHGVDSERFGAGQENSGRDRGGHALCEQRRMRRQSRQHDERGGRGQYADEVLRRPEVSDVARPVALNRYLIGG